MRKAERVKLTDEQAATLKMWVAAGRTEQRLAKRALVILYAAAGMSLKAIGSEISLGWQSCLKWRKRFVQRGLDGLQDKSRKGRPQVITPEERAHVMALACTSPDDSSNQWSVRKFADASGFSISSVHRILH
jgi:transposase